MKYSLNLNEDSTEDRRVVEAWALTSLEVASRATCALLRRPLTLEELIIRLKWGKGRSARSEARWKPARISLNLHAASVRDPISGVFREYKRFSRDSSISSFRSPDWKDHVTAVACHEMAHHAVWRRLEQEGWGPGKRYLREEAETLIDGIAVRLWLKPHTEPFRRAYAQIRTVTFIELFGILPEPSFLYS